MEIKLNQKQLLEIEKYLDHRRLIQIDLKYEVLDHMANGIESLMKEGKPFEQAFILEKQKWNKELRSYSSLWIGLVWSGPRIMMKMCERHIKKLYINVIWKSVVGAIFLMTLLNIFESWVNVQFIAYAMAGYYFFIAIALLVSLIQISKSKKQSTYRYLYKKNAAIILFYLLLFNPLTLFNPLHEAFSSGELNWYVLLTYFIMAFMGMEVFKLYKKHNGTLKKRAIK